MSTLDLYALTPAQHDRYTAAYAALVDAHSSGATRREIIAAERALERVRGELLAEVGEPEDIDPGDVAPTVEPVYREGFPAPVY